LGPPPPNFSRGESFSPPGEVVPGLCLAPGPGWWGGDGPRGKGCPEMVFFPPPPNHLSPRGAPGRNLAPFGPSRGGKPPASPPAGTPHRAPPQAPWEPPAPPPRGNKPPQPVFFLFFTKVSPPNEPKFPRVFPGSLPPVGRKRFPPNWDPRKNNASPGRWFSGPRCPRLRFPRTPANPGKSGGGPGPPASSHARRVQKRRRGGGLAPFSHPAGGNEQTSAPPPPTADRIKARLCWAARRKPPLTADL